MKAIPSTTICNFFYVFFVLYAVIFSLALLSILGVVISPKLYKAISVPTSASLVASTVIAGTQMLFFYLICSRSLLEVQQSKEGFLVVDAKEPTEETEEVKEKFANMKKKMMQ